MGMCLQWELEDSLDLVPTGKPQSGSRCIGKLQHSPFPASCLNGNNQRGAAAPSLGYTAAHWCLVLWEQQDGLKTELEVDATICVTGSHMGLGTQSCVWGILNKVSLSGKAESGWAEELWGWGMV